MEHDLGAVAKLFSARLVTLLAYPMLLQITDRSSSLLRSNPIFTPAAGSPDAQSNRVSRPIFCRPPGDRLTRPIYHPIPIGIGLIKSLQIIQDYLFGKSKQLKFQYIIFNLRKIISPQWIF
jgi:hypothetical protein